jgi:hypothetical protein
MDFLQMISQVGTDQWISDFVSNNKLLLGFSAAIVGSWLKGKYPAFFARLSTAIPFVGQPNKTIL